MSSQTTTSNSQHNNTQTTGLSALGNQYASGIFGQAAPLFQQAIGGLPEQKVLGLDPTQQKSIELLNRQSPATDNSAQYQSLYTDLQGLGNKQFNFGDYQNQFQEGYIDTVLANAQANNQGILAGIDRQNLGAGAFGGSAGAFQKALVGSQLNTQYNTLDSQLRSDAFNQAYGRFAQDRSAQAGILGEQAGILDAQGAAQRAGIGANTNLAANLFGEGSAARDIGNQQANVGLQNLLQRLGIAAQGTGLNFGALGTTSNSSGTDSGSQTTSQNTAGAIAGLLGSILSGAGQIGALGNKDGSTGLFGTLYNGLFGKSSSPPPTPITNINDYSGYGGAFGSRGA